MHAFLDGDDSAPHFYYIIDLASLDIGMDELWAAKGRGYFLCFRLYWGSVRVRIECRGYEDVTRVLYIGILK